MVSREGKEMFWADSEVEKDTIQGKFGDNKTEDIINENQKLKIDNKSFFSQN